MGEIKRKIKGEISNHWGILLGVSETTFDQSFDICGHVKKSKYIKADTNDVSICNCPGFEDIYWIDYEMICAFSIASVIKERGEIRVLSWW